MDNKDLVFLSYAREDQPWAERLYMDLRKQSVNVWLDIRCLKPGSDWKLEIKRTIRSSRQVILLMSRHSINKRGFIQREIRDAIETLKEVPRGEIFLIPARLDDTQPIDEELHDLNWVQLLPNYHDGLARILSALEKNRTAPLDVYLASDNSTAPSNQVNFVDRGSESTLSVPLVVGERAAIRYAPFRSAKEFLQQFMDRLPTDRIYADNSFSYYITVDTQHPDTTIGDDLRAECPEEITFVLRRAFSDLRVGDNGFSVLLGFGDETRNVGIPYDAIKMIDMPQLGITIRIGRPSLPLPSLPLGDTDARGPDAQKSDNRRTNR